MKNIEKLVRDGIIDKIRDKGEDASYRRASDEEFPMAIADKVVEEAKEIRDAIACGKPLEELIGEIADLREALDELCKIFDISNVDVVSAQEHKYTERKGFSGRYILNTL